MPIDHDECFPLRIVFRIVEKAINWRLYALCPIIEPYSMAGRIQPATQLSSAKYHLLYGVHCTELILIKPI